MGAPPRGVVVRNFPGQYTYRSVYCITMNITLKVDDAQVGSDLVGRRRAMYTDRYVYYGP